MSTNEEIVCLLQKAGQDEKNDLLLELWNQNQGFVKWMINRYSGTGKAEVDDLTQEIFIALTEAVKHWKPDAGSGFIGYWGTWIRQRFSRMSEHDSIMPAHIYQDVKRYRKILSEYEREKGGKPTTEELCEALDVSEKQLSTIKEASSKAEMLSLDSVAETGEGEEFSIADLIASPDNLEEDALKEIEEEELKKVIWPLVDGLPGDESEVLRRRYQKSQTLKEIGEKTGYSVNQVSSLQRKGLMEMRKPERSRFLQPFLEDERIRERALHGNGAEQFRRSWTSSTEKIALSEIEREEAQAPDEF